MEQEFGDRFLVALILLHNQSVQVGRGKLYSAVRVSLQRCVPVLIVQDDQLSEVRYALRVRLCAALCA